MKWNVAVVGRINIIYETSLWEVAMGQWSCTLPVVLF